MSILRHTQRAITSVSPAPNQGRWINPSKGGDRLLAPFFIFGTTSDASTPVGTPFAFDFTGSYRIEIKFRVDVAFGSNMVLVNQSNGTVMRIRFNAGGAPELTIGGTSITWTTLLPVVGKAYNMELIISAGDAGHICHLDPLDGAPDQSETKGAAGLHPVPVADQLFFSNIPAGTADFIGAMKEFKVEQSGVLAWHWPMDEGDPSTTFFELVKASGNEDATLNIGNGAWSDAP